jgi:hypothetical protein
MKLTCRAKCVQGARFGQLCLSVVSGSPLGNLKKVA